MIRWFGALLLFVGIFTVAGGPGGLWADSSTDLVPNSCRHSLAVPLRAGGRPTSSLPASSLPASSPPPSSRRASGRRGLGARAGGQNQGLRLLGADLGGQAEPPRAGARAAYGDPGQQHRQPLGGEQHIVGAEAPVQHAQRHGLAANRAQVMVFDGLGGMEVDAAFPVAVMVVFAFLGIKFKGPQELIRVAGFQGGFDGGI